MARRTRTARLAALRGLGTAVGAGARPGAPGLLERLAALPRMVSAAVSGRYRGLSTGRLLAVLGTLVYVVSPIDVVPEGILTVFGLADDAMVVAWLASVLLQDTDDYLAWERGYAPAAASGSQARATGRGPQDMPVQDAPAPGSSGHSTTIPSHVVR
ncbi:MAG: hypothetical protein CSA84_07035 [Actinomycetales bacterium]|nr:MAG: hypothetical protein CSA84_07035 [Actinomycetales bacterium]